MLTLINGVMQYSKAFKPTLLDFLPRGRYGAFIVFGDILLVLFIFFILGRMTLATLEVGLVSSVIMLVFMIIPIYVNGKELEEAKADIAKARAINREKGLFDAEKEAHLSRVEMELQGLRSRVKRHKNSVDILISENNGLKKVCEALKREKIDLAKKIDELRNSSFDDGEMFGKKDEFVTMLVEENIQLKNMNEQLRKLSDVQKIKNAELIEKQKFLRFNPENKWMAYIPYAEGDSFDDIKKAYRVLAKALHPDSGSGNEEKMRKLNEAFEKAEVWFKNLNNS